MCKEADNLIKRIDNALDKMEKLGHKNHPSYFSLKAKRDAIFDGANYKIVDVTEKVIGSCGELFSNILKYYNLTKFK